MDARRILSRSLAIAVASLAAWPAVAGPVYRSIDSSGTVIYMDVPPPEARLPPAPSCFCMPEPDQATAIANARVDRAEHELALARQNSGPHDRSRIDFYKRGVQVAHQQLAEVLRSRRP
jgi:hypothetical protein